MKLFITCISLVLAANLFGQVTQGRVVFERRTNLKKVFKNDKRVSEMLNDKNKYRNEKFELHFNESGSSFKYIEPETEDDMGWMKFLTQHHTVYQDLENDQITVVMDFMGSIANMQDSSTQRTWKITDRSREFDGYKGIRAIWEMNDSTNIYAWFCPDIVPVSGPEGLNGLPGLILGLATEDGSVIYMAKEVEIMEVPNELVDAPEIKEDIYSREELIQLLIKQMGRWRKPEEIRAGFMWY
ncbi:MAG: GLPGLI family protein [bacterium]|nr:GLPGLI family protein [bacterium]